MRGHVAVLCVALAAAPAAAQPESEVPAEDAPAPAPTKDPKQAKKWRDTGATLVSKGDALTRRKKLDDAKVQYENAVTAFQRAMEFGADANVAYELGVAHDKLGTHDEAYKILRTVVKAGSGARPDIVKKATAKLDELSTKIGLVMLLIKPEGATISIGGNEVGRSPLEEPLVLAPGTYTIALSADGFEPKQTEIKVEAGSESERTLELEAMEIIVTPPDPPDEQPVAPPPVATASKTPMFVGGGAAVALFGVATVTGLMARSAHDTFTSTTSTEDERSDAQSRGKKLALVTDLCLVGGVAAAGFTAYWYFAKYRGAQQKSTSERAAREAAKLDVVPWVKLDAGGFAVAGSF